MLIGPLPPWRSRRRSSGEPSRLRWRRTLTSGMGWRDNEATTLARPTIVVDSDLWKVYPAGVSRSTGRTNWDCCSSGDTASSERGSTSRSAETTSKEAASVMDQDRSDGPETVPEPGPTPEPGLELVGAGGPTELPRQDSNLRPAG